MCCSCALRCKYENKKMAGPDKDDFYKIRWCKCDECFTMTAKADEKCCFPDSADWFHAEQCVTKQESFERFVQAELTITKLDHANVTNVDVGTWSHPYQKGDRAFYRRKAYDVVKKYAITNMPAMYEKEWELCLPSCVKWYIRQLADFTETNNIYTGYFPQSGRYSI